MRRASFSSIRKRRASSTQEKIRDKNPGQDQKSGPKIRAQKSGTEKSGTQKSGTDLFFLQKSGTKNPQKSGTEKSGKNPGQIYFF
jgi:hypothetical protein